MKKDEPDLAGVEPATEGVGRRQHARHLMTRFVWYHTIGLEGREPVEGLSFSKDVSLGGLGLVVTEAIPKDSFLMVVIVFHSDMFNLSAVCRVVHTQQLENGSHSLGLEYEVLPPDSRQFLSGHFS